MYYDEYTRTKPRKSYSKYKLVSISNPNYKKQLERYKESLKKDAERLAKKLSSIKSKIKKTEEELQNF